MEQSGAVLENEQRVEAVDLAVSIHVCVLLAGRGAEALAGDPALGDALGSLAQGNDASVRLSELSAANGHLRAAIAQLGVATQGSASELLRSLRQEVIDSLRIEAESRSFALMGPRADG